MTETEYAIAWGIYALAGVGIYGIMWWLSRHWLVAVRIPVLVLLAALVVTPSSNDVERSLWAPAVTVSMFSLIDGDIPAAIRGFIPVLWVALVLLIFVIPVHMWSRRRKLAAS